MQGPVAPVGLQCWGGLAMQGPVAPVGLQCWGGLAMQGPVAPELPQGTRADLYRQG